MSAEPVDEATKRAQTAAWTCGGGFFHRFNGVDHACMPIDQWRQFMDVCAETADAAVAAARAEERAKWQPAIALAQQCIAAAYEDRWASFDSLSDDFDDACADAVLPMKPPAAIRDLKPEGK